MFIILLLMMFLFVLAIREKKNHQLNIDAIPIRININGIRGKSTVTRLVTSILKEAGLKVVGKTTGTSARMIYWFTEEEKPIVRLPEGPNIREQKFVVKEAAELEADALVSECMAVNPDYQIIFQEQMLQANIGVIVNVLEDHLDVMGPTLDEVAEAFAATIPWNGMLIISDSQYMSYFRDIALERGTQTFVANVSRVSDLYLRQFDYIIFPENVALALAVAEALEIDEKVALEGMSKAQPDPGVLRIVPLGSSTKPSYFVNGFAANDATSTLRIWNRVRELGYPILNPIVIMNCRPDRVDRTEQFATDVLPYIEIDTLIVMGELIDPIVQAIKGKSILTKSFYNLEGKGVQEALKILNAFASNRIIFGVGNIHGAAEELIKLLIKNQLTVEKMEKGTVNIAITQ